MYYIIIPDGAEQSSLMLPFSMRSILGIWPVGNRKHFDICTSSLVLKLDSCSIQDILHLRLCHCPRMKFPTYPQNHIPGYSANHDLDLAVSLSLAKATFADFNLDLSAEIILHRLFTGSISWIYKYPRTITSVSLQVCGSRSVVISRCVCTHFAALLDSCRKSFSILAYLLSDLHYWQ